MTSRGLAALTLAVACATTAAANDIPPELVGRFTRQVQPLLMNRCAAGACHGGPVGHEPRFERGSVSTRPDRVHTLANMSTFLSMVGHDRDPGRIVRLLATTHPAAAGRSRLTAAPLTASERRTIESWLTDVRIAEAGHRRDPAVRQASAVAPPQPGPNRFRDMLDAASNPPPLAPPHEPAGVIFPRDDGSAAEPPTAPEPPPEP
jgi:hypothetical protein